MIRADEDGGIHEPYFNPGHGEQNSIGQNLRHLLGIGSERPTELAGVFQQQRDADGGDQHVEPWRAAKRAIGETFDAVTSKRAERDRPDRNRNCQKNGMSEKCRAMTGGVDQAGRDGITEPCAQGEDVAVGEIDELQDAENQRVTQCDEGVQCSDGNSIGQCLNERLERMIHAAFGTCSGGTITWGVLTIEKNEKLPLSSF